MFKFLKDKLKSAISTISDKIKSKPEEEQQEPVLEAKEEKSSKPEIKKDKAKKKEKKSSKQELVEEPVIDIQVPLETKPEQEIKKPEPELKVEEIEVKEEEKKGFFTRLKEKITTKITTTTISESEFEKLFEDLEIALLENNVAYEVVDKIKQDLKSKLVNNPIKRSNVEKAIEQALKESIESLLESQGKDIIEEIKAKNPKPYVICFVGINGSGKTTTISKFAQMIKDNGFKCVLSASDTFRAASIDQLEEHANKLGVKLIKHNYGSDPAAVAFDSISYAKSHDIDVVLIDTAGRMHSNENLIQEMKKIIRVSNPDLKVFIGESITGNDCIEQARIFNEAINFDGIILTKADVDEKGGAAISISYVTKKPILYLGVGQAYKDLEIFNPKKVIKSLGFE